MMCVGQEVSQTTWRDHLIAQIRDLLSKGKERTDPKLNPWEELGRKMALCDMALDKFEKLLKEDGRDALGTD